MKNVEGWRTRMRPNEILDSPHTFHGLVFDDHWRLPVQAGNYTVLCSSYMVNGRGGRTPDLGVYLDDCWKAKFGGGLLANRGQSPGPKSNYPALIIPWPDMGVIDVDTLRSLVKRIHRALAKGMVVDIGCHGGHGRTGTLLACLIASEESMSAAEAVRVARKRYCRNAVETEAQEDLVGRAMKTPCIK